MHSGRTLMIRIVRRIFVILKRRNKRMKDTLPPACSKMHSNQSVKLQPCSFCRLQACFCHFPCQARNRPVNWMPSCCWFPPCPSPFALCSSRHQSRRMQPRMCQSHKGGEQVIRSSRKRAADRHKTLGSKTRTLLSLKNFGRIENS